MIPNARPKRSAFRRLRRTHAVVLLAAILVGGCYRYVPAEPHGLKRGDAVRAQLAPVPVEVGDIAIREVATVDGEFVSIMDERVVLSAMWLTSRTGREFAGLGSTVEFERTSLQELLEKRLDLGRTTLAAAALTAGAALLHSILSSAGGVSGDGSGGGGGGPPK